MNIDRIKKIKIDLNASLLNALKKGLKKGLKNGQKRILRKEQRFLEDIEKETVRN